MTNSPMPSDIEQLPQGWRSLWRAHASMPSSAAADELTIFVRAGDRDPQVVGAFCRAHQGKTLRTTEMEFLPIEFEVWSIYNVQDEYVGLTGIPLVHVIQKSPPDPDGVYYC